MRFQFPLIFIFTALFLIGNYTVNGQVTDQEVADLSVRINGVEKVEQLYSIRYAVGKYAARTDLTLRQQQLLMNSMRLLSDEFKMRSHFKNAADVYKEYLDYNNNYLVSYNAFATDSLKAVHKNISEKETSEISSLGAEITSLTDKRAAVSGLKAKYYSAGTIGAIAVVVLTLIIGLSRIRAIKQAETSIESNREKLVQMNRTATDAGMKEGIVAFCKKTAADNSQLINTIIESVDQQEEKKIFQKEIVALRNAEKHFNGIAS